MASLPTSVLAQESSRHRVRKELVATPSEPLQCINQVTRGTFTCPVDLSMLAVVLSARLGQQFPAVVVALQDPRCTLEIFQTGKMVITGGVDEEQMIMVMWLLKGIVYEATGQWLNFQGLMTHNVVAKAYVGQLLDLERLSTDPRYQGNCRYEKELFGGLAYTPEKQPQCSNGHITCVLFTYGSVIVTGGRNMKDTLEVYTDMVKILPEFYMTPEVVRQHKQKRTQEHKARKDGKRKKRKQT